MQLLLFYKALTLIRQRITIKYRNLHLGPYLSNKDSAFARNDIILEIIFILSSQSGLPIGNLI